jgi:prepilin peptidase CpaA
MIEAAKRLFQDTRDSWTWIAVNSEREQFGPDCPRTEMVMIPAAIMVIFPLCLAMAACSDLLTMTIPNRLSVVLIASFALIAPFSGLSMHDILMHFGAGGAVFAACFVLFAFNNMGGGDAKILTASSIWFGFNDSLINYLAYVSILGGFLSIIILMMRTQHNLILAYGIPIPETMLHKKKVPYGIAIGAAALMAYPMSPIVKLALAF